MIKIEEKRLGFVGIIVEERKTSAAEINRILSEFGDLIIGRLGIPRSDKKINVISLIVEATTDEIGSMTGKIGLLKGVKVKSSLSKIF